jgi:hypothetical protein
MAGLEIGRFAILRQVISTFWLDNFLSSNEELLEHEITSRIRLPEVYILLVAKENLFADLM